MMDTYAAASALDVQHARRVAEREFTEEDRDKAMGKKATTSSGGKKK